MAVAGDVACLFGILFTFYLLVSVPAMDQLNARLEQLAKQNEQLVTEITQLHARVQAAEANQAASPPPPQAAPPPTPTTPSIDTRYIGKPETFDGIKGWRDWSTVFSAYCSAINPSLQALMMHAREELTPCLNATLPTEHGASSAQLYFMLVMTCKDAALTRVINAGQAEGLEAWRSLYQHFEPRSSTRHAGLLMDLLSVDLSGDIQAKIELFNRDVVRYETSSGEKLAESVKVGTILKNMPEGGLKQHLILNIHKFTTWALLANEIIEVRRAQSAAQSGPQPMVVDALVQKQVSAQLKALGIKGKGFGGKDGGKGGKGKPSKPCPICGKAHWKSECWCNKDGGNYKGNKGKGKGADGGKPTSNRGGKGSGVKCYSCGQEGHISKDCPKKKGTAHSLEEGQAQQDGTKASGSSPSAPSDTQLALTDGLVASGLFLAALGHLPISRITTTKPTQKCDKITLGVDSCAAISVGPPSLAASRPVQKTTLTGHTLYTATGQKVYEKGIVAFKGTAADGFASRLNLHLVDGLSKSLLAVNDLVENGCRVIFDKEDGEDASIIIHKATGRRIPMIHRNRIWDLEFYVSEDASTEAVPLCPFTRQVPQQREL